MLLTDKDIEAIRLNKFRLDCPTMELVPMLEGSRRSYSGSGFISMTEENLDFTLYSRDPYDKLEAFQGLPLSAKAGEFIEDVDFYELKSIDVRGRSWRSRYLLPIPTFGSGIVLRDTLSGIEAEEKHQLNMSGAVLKLWFPGRLNIPTNHATHSIAKVGERTINESMKSDSAKLTCAGYDFFVRVTDDWSIVEASKDISDLPPQLQRRIEGSLEFILGHPLRALIVQEFKPGEFKMIISSRKAQLPRAGAKPPLLHHSAEHQSAWILFDHFFRHTEKYEGELMPPLSRIVQYVVQMNLAPIDAQALALGVAVEGILKEEFPQAGKPSGKFLQELQKVSSMLLEIDLPEAAPRIRGALDAMKDVRAKDQLLGLVQAGVIKSEQYQAWARLRNSTAHASVHDLDNKFLNIFYRVLVLAYCLIFKAIGYQGPFTDYGVPGWPESTYPFSGQNEGQT